MRTESHKADPARLSGSGAGPSELARLTIESIETFWTVLHQAGPEKFVQALKDSDAKDYGRDRIQAVRGWLKDRAA